jgi:hypothetical protein
MAGRCFEIKGWPVKCSLTLVTGYQYIDERSIIMAQQTTQTGTRDVGYDLVSILYHALQGAETYGMYIKDAEQAGANEVVQFFREVQQEERRRADRAKELLRQQWG